jgi:hypothetical protein
MATLITIDGENKTLHAKIKIAQYISTEDTGSETLTHGE